MLEIEDLDYIQYLIYRHDAFIWRFSQSEKGTEYLDNAWRLEQTVPDRKKLREKYGTKEE